MTGLLLIAVVGLWFWLVFNISKAVSRWITQGRWRWPIAALMFVVLLPLPVLDEVIGGFQFRELCEESAAFLMGVEKPEGRTTKVTIQPSNRRLEGTAIDILHSHIEYHDVATGELVVAYDRYVAKGGIFIRALGISEGNAPISIGQPSCSPTSRTGESPRLTFKFNVIN